MVYCCVGGLGVGSEGALSIVAGSVRGSFLALMVHVYCYALCSGVCLCSCAWV